MVSFDAKLEAAGGRPTGFDYLRIILSCLVVVSHVGLICYGFDYAEYLNNLPGLQSLLIIVLPMFFSLSGFLVAGSMARAKSLLGFLGLRAIRIYPALTVEVLLSAFLLGPFFTTFPLSAYFTDHLFIRYLVNVTGHISFLLPGVFIENPLPSLVNRQLWTVPYELYCYLAISIVMIIGLSRRRGLFFIGLIALTILYAGVTSYRHGIGPIVGAHVSGPQLIFAFLAGVLLYLYRDRVRFSHILGPVSGIVSLVLYTIPLGEYPAALTSAYFTVYIGLTNPRKIGMLRGADYSYGVYLYGFPVQQAIVATGDWARIWWIHLPVAMLLSGAFAALSWHMIEKPALELKGPLKRLEGRWLSVRSRLTRRNLVEQPASSPAE